MMNSLAESEESTWKVWLTRILVAAAIALTLEFLGKRPAPQLKKDEQRKVLQYSEITRAVETPTVEENELREETLTEDTAQTSNGESNPCHEEKEPDTKSKQEPTTRSDATTPVLAYDSNKFRNKGNNHPGMEGFHRWYDIETSLFRQYNVGRTDGVDVIPPYVKKSRNGQVQVALQVVNHLTGPSRDQRINVYWINYQGHEVLKGSIRLGETWHQTTYIEHPWVFRTSDTHQILLHYIPERVIPHLEEAPTVDDDDPMVGVQRFIIQTPTPQAVHDRHVCSIDDKVMPHPAAHHFHNPNIAHSWTLLQMKRMDYFTHNPGATLLSKYFTNIAVHPENPKYRRIRIANRNFANGIWQTPARGLLLAVGFVEQQAFAELGTEAPLSSESVQDISLALLRLEQCLAETGQSSSGSGIVQPFGADGFGRAGYGRAGQMN